MFNTEPLTSHEIESLWGKAIRDGAKDIAETYFLAFHYVGEARLKQIGRWDLYEKTKTLPDYPQALESVKRAYQRLCEFQLGIKPNVQGQDWAIKKSLCIDGVRWAQNDEQKAARMQTHALTFMAALLRQDLDFFRQLGTALAASPPKNLNEHELAHTLVSNWLTGFLWLMDTKTSASTVAQIHQIEEPASLIQTIKRLKIKDRWNLYSTKPALVCCFKDRGELEFTPRGKALLFPK